METQNAKSKKTIGYFIKILSFISVCVGIVYLISFISGDVSTQLSLNSQYQKLKEIKDVGYDYEDYEDYEKNAVKEALDIPTDNYLEWTDIEEKASDKIKSIEVGYKTKFTVVYAFVICLGSTVLFGFGELIDRCISIDNKLKSAE